MIVILKDSELFPESLRNKFIKRVFWTEEYHYQNIDWYIAHVKKLGKEDLNGNFDIY